MDVSGLFRSGLQIQPCCPRCDWNEKSFPDQLNHVAYTADESYGHVVVYIPVGKPFFAVEPVTNANDGFNLLAKAWRARGIFVLEPGQAGAATFRLTVSSAAG